MSEHTVESLSFLSHLIMGDSELHSVACFVEYSLDACNDVREDVIAEIGGDNTDISALVLYSRNTALDESTASTNTGDDIFAFKAHESLSYSLTTDIVDGAKLLFCQKSVVGFELFRSNVLFSPFYDR